jgi:signal transduction histidine kinase
VCTELKAKPDLRDIPVIFLTAMNETADKVRAFDVGGVDYVTKPFQIDEVIARVKTHVALRRAQTELSQSYVKLQALEQLRDDLVHMVVHDMRAPLQVLKWCLDFLQSRQVSNFSAETAQDVGEALHAVGVLTRMANDLLDVSRLEEGKMPVERTTMDLTALAREVSAAIGSLDRERSIVVEADGSVEAECDKGLLQRVLENLVGNAIKHTPAGGRIAVSLAVRDRRVRVVVSDEGPGIPPETRDQIFEKFGVLASRRDKKYHSVGLGLAFCRLAVEAHGGTIGVDAGEPAGSRFWFELPL